MCSFAVNSHPLKTLSTFHLRVPFLVNQDGWERATGTPVQLKCRGHTEALTSLVPIDAP